MDNQDFDKYIVSIDYNHQKFVKDLLNRFVYLVHFSFEFNFAIISHKYYCSQNQDIYTTW